MKEFLAAHPIIGLGSAFGTSLAPLFVEINPVLQFLGLCAGIVIGYLTIEAKLAERRERKKKPSIDPELIQDFKNKADKAKNGKSK